MTNEANSGHQLPEECGKKSGVPCGKEKKVPRQISLTLLKRTPAERSNEGI